VQKLDILQKLRSATSQFSGGTNIRHILLHCSTDRSISKIICRLMTFIQVWWVWLHRCSSLISVSCWISSWWVVIRLFIILTITDNTGSWTKPLAVINCQRWHSISSLVRCCRDLLCEHFVKPSYKTVDVRLCNAKCSGSCEVCARVIRVMSAKPCEVMSRYFLFCTVCYNSVSAKQRQQRWVNLH